MTSGGENMYCLCIQAYRRFIDTNQGVGQEQGLPQGVNFWKNCINEGYSELLRMIIMATLRSLRQPGPSG